MTDPKEQVVSEALCRNHLSGFAEVCAGVCGNSTVPGQPHPCEHALTVWRSDAQEILRALLARVDPKALEELDLASRAIERARVLLAGEDNSVAAGAAPIDPVAEKLWLWRDGEGRFLAFRSLFPTMPDSDDPATLGQPSGYAFYHRMTLAEAKKVSREAWPGTDASGEKAGLTQASDSLARPSVVHASDCAVHNEPAYPNGPCDCGAHPSPAVRDALMDSQYLAGAKAGWNAAQADDPNAAMQAICDGRKGYLKPLAEQLSSPGAVRDVTLREALEAACRRVHDTFKRDLKQGYVTRDKQFAVDILGAALSHPSLPDGGKP